MESGGDALPARLYFAVSYFAIHYDLVSEVITYLVTIGRAIYLWQFKFRYPVHD